MLTAVALGAAVVGTWPVLVAVRAGVPLVPWVLSAHVCGMLAGYGVVALLTLMSRAPALERGVGADVLTRWHSRGGRIVVLLVLAHACSAVVAWAGSRQPGVLALRDVLGLPGLVGTRVLAEGPHGAMTAPRRTQRDVLLVAGGLGITPVRALFETMPLAPRQRLTLLYRARTVDDVLFQTELEDIARRRGATIRYLAGREPDCLTPQRLARLVPGLARHDGYLCGAPRMAAAARSGLLGAGVPAHQLHEVRFAF